MWGTKRKHRPNPSGASRQQVLLTVGTGLAMGLLGGVLLHTATGAQEEVSLLLPRVLVGVIAGATFGAGAVLLLSWLLDRWAPWGDPLLGYGGTTRLLWHAGELSQLGAIGGGIGSTVGGVILSALAGGVIGLLVGGIVYQLRGLGGVLGGSAGLIAGAVGALLGSLLL